MPILCGKISVWRGGASLGCPGLVYMAGRKISRRLPPGSSGSLREPQMVAVTILQSEAVPVEQHVGKVNMFQSIAGQEE